jgi:hypothetical protein
MRCAGARGLFLRAATTRGSCILLVPLLLPPSSCPGSAETAGKHKVVGVDHERVYGLNSQGCRTLTWIEIPQSALWIARTSSLKASRFVVHPSP